jgi:hypothetical protein
MGSRHGGLQIGLDLRKHRIVAVASLAVGVVYRTGAQITEPFEGHAPAAFPVLVVEEVILGHLHGQVVQREVAEEGGLHPRVGRRRSRDALAREVVVVQEVLRVGASVQHVPEFDVVVSTHGLSIGVLVEIQDELRLARQRAEIHLPANRQRRLFEHDAVFAVERGDRQRVRPRVDVGVDVGPPVLGVRVEQIDHRVRDVERPPERHDRVHGTLAGDVHGFGGGRRDDLHLRVTGVGDRGGRRDDLHLRVTGVGDLGGVRRRRGVLGGAGSTAGEQQKDSEH